MSKEQRAEHKATITIRPPADLPAYRGDSMLMLMVRGKFAPAYFDQRQYKICYLRTLRPYPPEFFNQVEWWVVVDELKEQGNRGKEQGV